jgi:hypothetical protein
MKYIKYKLKSLEVILNQKSKLKRNREYIPGLILGITALLYTAAIVVEDHLWGTHYTPWLYGATIIGFTIWFAFRYRMLQMIFIGLLVGTAAWHYELAKHMDTRFSQETFNIHLIVMTVAIILLVPYVIMIQKRFQMFQRRILELAAKPINDISDGFTSRPYPAGEVDTTREEIVGFSQFLKRKRIAVSSIDEDKVILFLSPNPGLRAFMQKSDLAKSSYISYDFNGNVSVHMTKSDYQQYKEELTFDQLCQSLANLFNRFLDYYRKGEFFKIDELLRDDRLKRMIRIQWVVKIAGVLIFLFAVIMYFIAVSNR